MLKWRKRRNRTRPAREPGEQEPADQNQTPRESLTRDGGDQLPSVSVVLTVGPRQGRFLAECLDSLTQQNLRPTEVLLCPWGEDPGAHLPQASDHRVLESSVTANAARNRGAAEAAAMTVVFLEATETLVPRALATLAERWTVGTDSIGTREGELATRLWRRDAVPRFRPAHGRFPHAALQTPPDRLVDHQLARHTDRTWAVAFNQNPPAAAELGELTALLGDLTEPSACARVLDRVVPEFLDDLEHAEDVAREAFAQALREQFQAMHPAQLLEVSIETRLRAWLAAEGHHQRLYRLDAEQLRPRGHTTTVVRDGSILATHEAAAGLLDGLDVPEPVRALKAELTASLRTLHHEDGTLRLGVFAGIAWIDSLQHPPTLTAHLRHADGERREANATPRRGDHRADRFFAQRHQDHSGSSFEVVIPLAELESPGPWHLELEVSAGGIPIAGRIDSWDPRSSAGLLDAGPGARAVMDSRTGFHIVVGEQSRRTEPEPSAPQLTAVALGPGLRLDGVSPEPFEAFLAHAQWRVPLDVNWREGRFVVTSDLCHDPWQLGAHALPSGTWALRWASTQGDGELPIPDGPAAETPWEKVLPTHRVTVRRGLRDQLVLDLGPPLLPEERSVSAQERMRSAYLTSEAPVDPSLALFWSYAGTGVTDSPRAIFEELRSRRPEMRCVWMVADRSVAVPKGVETVLIRSQEWYDVLARAALIVTNIEMDPFFRRRPGQRVVQTFHGYPAKSMGIHEWTTKNLTPTAIEEQLRRTSGTWSVALTPTPAMDRHYREQYSYSGPLLNRGYPRDDELVAPGRDLRRQAARARLGLLDSQTVVLYAPTWREEEATNFRRAQMSTLLDVSRVAAALEDHVILLRGHRFHSASPESGTRIRDVSTYPEINDLILAADVAVLDYSSLRFDVALVGTPMLFLVPDLEDYTSRGRGFLFPFTDSAPGPLLADTDGVIEALRGLDRVRDEHAAAIAEFNARYHSDQDGRSASRVVDHILGTDPE